MSRMRTLEVASSPRTADMDDVDHPFLNALAIGSHGFAGLRTIHFRMESWHTDHRMVPTHRLWRVLASLPALETLHIILCDRWLPSDLHGVVFAHVRTIVFDSYGPAQPENGADELSAVFSAFTEATFCCVSTTADELSSFDAASLAGMAHLRTFSIHAWDWREELWAFLDQHLPSTVRDFEIEVHCADFEEGQADRFVVPLRRLTSIGFPAFLEPKGIVACIDDLNLDSYPSLRSVRVEADSRDPSFSEELRDGLRQRGQWDYEGLVQDVFSWRRTDRRTDINPGM